MRNQRQWIIFIVMMTVTFFAVSCAKKEAAKKEKIIAKVNDEPIYESDLNRSLIVKSRMNPKLKMTQDIINNELNTIIDRKIIIQEAMKKNLAQEKEFVDTIKTFWEQTLIRNFVNVKRKELQGEISISEEEIANYYNNLKERVTFSILRSENKEEVASIYKDVTDGGDLTQYDWQEVGPVIFPEINTPVLLKAFHIPEGQATIITQEPYYYLVRIKKREKVDLAPLENIKPQVRELIRPFKEQQVIEKWLREKRKQAKIQLMSSQ